MAKLLPQYYDSLFKLSYLLQFANGNSPLYGQTDLESSTVVTVETAAPTLVKTGLPTSNDRISEFYDQLDDMALDDFDEDLDELDPTARLLFSGEPPYYNSTAAGNCSIHEVWSFTNDSCICDEGYFQDVNGTCRCAFGTVPDAFGDCTAGGPLQCPIGEMWSNKYEFMHMCVVRYGA